MYVLYSIYFMQAVPYTFISYFTDKHVYHVDAMHYLLLIMCTYILSLLLFYHDCILIACYLLSDNSSCS